MIIVGEVKCPIGFRNSVSSPFTTEIQMKNYAVSYCTHAAVSYTKDNREFSVSYNSRDAYASSKTFKIRAKLLGSPCMGCVTVSDRGCMTDPTNCKELHAIQVLSTDS